MIYTVTQSKDEQMYEFWSEYADKKPMLCATIHEDCLDHNIVNTVKEAGEAEIYFEFVEN